MTTKATVEVWLERLSETVPWGANRPLSSDDEKIVRLWEALVQLVGEMVLKGYYFDFVNSDAESVSLQSVGIVFLMDAYEMREFDANERAGIQIGTNDGKSFDNRYIMAREVWRRGEVRRQIVDAVRLVIDNDATSNERTMDPETRQLLESIRMHQLNSVRAEDPAKIATDGTRDPPLEKTVKPTESEVDRIAKKLAGKRPAIFRYLSRNPAGVSFSEFQDAKCDNGRSLTNSENPDSIATMIRALARDLEEHGWTASAKVTANLIKAERLGEEKT